ncbi:AMSH ubiquitin thioesterase 2 [Spatholobus suberectus]|nr:AMSH ubiquitin thioesterase 2 [Spatholobus suberectus]
MEPYAAQLSIRQFRFIVPDQNKKEGEFVRESGFNLDLVASNILVPSVGLNSAAHEGISLGLRKEDYLSFELLKCIQLIVQLLISQMYKRSNEEQDVSNKKVRNCDTSESQFSKSWPSPALCFVETVPQDAQNSHITAFNSGDGSSKSDNESTSSKTIRDVHISMRLMEDFLDLAKENTEKDLETCGILGAYLEKGTLYMTTLIIPKQESASNSCQATNEEEVFKILNERSLYPVGWIHTHPSQSCFMSSVDLHTQYSYQVMIPEAFAIVLAPNDTIRSCGLFRLTEPEGMNILKNCQETGFHPHKEPDNGNPVYEHCSNMYKNSNLRFEIFDLRFSTSLWTFIFILDANYPH